MDSDPFDETSEENKPASTATDFFEGGAPSCRFNNIGDVHKGIVKKFDEAQQHDIATKQPKFWKDGNPCQMLVITLQTEERDAEIDDDDGERKLYVNKPSGMFAAIGTALKAAKAKLEIGGMLAVKYVKSGKPKQAGFNAPKEYAAKYLPPGGSMPASAPAAVAGKAIGSPLEEAAAARRMAWELFNKQFPGDKETVAALWLKMAKTYFGDIPTTKLTKKEWQEFIADGFVKPDANGPPTDPAMVDIDESEIPF